MSGPWTDDLIRLSAEVWSRLDERISGLDDEEYLWEPVAGCWSIGPRPSGTWTHTFTLPEPEPAPVTTIAWRIWHLIDLYGEDRTPRFLAVPAQGPAIEWDDPNGAPPATAAGARELLARAHERWEAHLSLADDDLLGQTIGAVGGHFADRTKGSFVLHMLDEFIHHTAEIALLRDLWRWQHAVRDDALADRVAHGDRGALDAIAELAESDATALLDLAASFARWDLVRSMVASGVSVATEGRTPLHHAAVAGKLDVVQLLVDAGADVNGRDPDFDATPAQWARFTDRSATVAWLERQAGP